MNGQKAPGRSLLKKRAHFFLVALAWQRVCDQWAARQSTPNSFPCLMPSGAQRRHAGLCRRNRHD